MSQMEHRETPLTGLTCEQWGQEQSVMSDVQEAKDKIRPARGLLGGRQRFGVNAWEESEREQLIRAQTWGTGGPAGNLDVPASSSRYPFPLYV